MPINGCHYDDYLPGRDLPDGAYRNREIWDKTTGHGAWKMVKGDRSSMANVFFANGRSPQEYAELDGDRCFLGMTGSRHGRGLYGKILSEGWRWDEVAAWHFWTDFEDGTWINSWQTVALLCRE